MDLVARRITCEMREMVVEDDNNPASFHSSFLLTNDYVAEIALSLDVTNTGGLAPSLSYLNPVASFALSGSGTFSEARDANFTENIQLSFRKIYDSWKFNHIPFACPSADTNLAGDLGLRDFVALAARTPHLDQGSGSDSPEVFGGTVQFLVTKQVNSFGPTWTLVHFVGPGSVNLSQVNTDKITLSFARGKEAGKPLAEHLVLAKADFSATTLDQSDQHATERAPNSHDGPVPISIRCDPALVLGAPERDLTPSLALGPYSRRDQHER